MKLAKKLYRKFWNFFYNEHFYHIWSEWRIIDPRVPIRERECKYCGRVEQVDYAGFKKVIKKGMEKKNENENIYLTEKERKYLNFQQSYVVNNALAARIRRGYEKRKGNIIPDFTTTRSPREA